jgi:hypothetical protein
MRIDTETKRVRHEIADGVAVMVLSLGSSVALVLVIALVLGSL